VSMVEDSGIEPLTS